MLSSLTMSSSLMGELEEARVGIRRGNIFLFITASLREMVYLANDPTKRYVD